MDLEQSVTDRKTQNSLRNLLIQCGLYSRKQVSMEKTETEADALDFNAEAMHWEVMQFATYIIEEITFGLSPWSLESSFIPSLPHSSS